MVKEEVKIIECPRDAMQGIHEFIPTEKKAAYINALLKCGFDTIDFGSFVSPKAIPQMRDTEAVLKSLELNNTNSKLLAIIANARGAADAVAFEEIDYLGFPFSISETFQQRNTNSGIEESLKRVEEIQALCVKHNKKLVVYISMAFGNPYGDVWNPEIVINWTKKLTEMGIEIIALADTIGIADAKIIDNLFSDVVPEFKNIEIGAHLHTTADTWEEKLAAAYKNGCKRFDSAIKGYGGCPMAKDDLVGNMATENLIQWFDNQSIKTNINSELFKTAYKLSGETFPL